MARRILNPAAGAGRHALPAALLLHVAAASEPPVAVAWADTDARAIVCSMSPASRSTRGVIDTRSSKPLPNPNASGSRYPSGSWLTAGGRAAANSGRHIGVEPVPSPPAVVARRRGSCLSAHMRGASVAKPARAAMYRPSARCCFLTALISKTLRRTNPGRASSNELRLCSTRYQRVTPAGISPPGCVRRMSKRCREASRSNDQKVTVRTVERKVCHL